MNSTALVLIGFFSLNLWAAKPNPSIKSYAADKKVFSFTAKQKNEVMEALKVPLKNRLTIFNKKPRRSFYILKALAFDESQPIKIRWRALTSFAAVGKGRATKSLGRAAKSKHWYMRNAALLGAQMVEDNYAAMMAADLLHDPSLIVRTEAVRLLKDTNAQQYKGRLIQQLNSPQNFKGKKSLWVRKHIAEAIYKFMEKSDKKVFVKMLYDSDPEVQRYGVLGMERYHQKRISKSKKLAQHVSDWKRQVR